MKPTQQVGGYIINVRGVSYSVYQYQDNQGKTVFVAHPTDEPNSELYHFRLTYEPKGKVVLPKEMIPYQPYCIATGKSVANNIAYSLLDSFIYEWLKPLHGVGSFHGEGAVGKTECSNGAYHWERADDEEGEEEQFIPIPNRFRLTKDGIVVYGDGYESGIVLPWNDYPIPTAHLSDTKDHYFVGRKSITHNINRVTHNDK